MEAGTAAAAQRICHDEQRGGLHLTCQNTEALPGFPFLQQLIGDGHLRRAVLAVECVLALHDADMRLLTHGERSLTQGIGHIKVGNGRILERRIFLRRVLKADGSRRNDDIAGLDLQVDAAAGTDADERVRTDVVAAPPAMEGGRAADAVEQTLTFSPRSVPV